MQQTKILILLSLGKNSESLWRLNYSQMHCLSDPGLEWASSASGGSSDLSGCCLLQVLCLGPRFFPWRDRILAFLLSQILAGRVSIPVWPKVWSFFHPPPTCRVGALAKVLRSRISEAYCPRLSSFVGLPSGPGAPLLVQGCSERATAMLHPPLTLTQHSHSSSRAMTLRIFPGKKAGCECTKGDHLYLEQSINQSASSVDQ